MAQDPAQLIEQANAQISEFIGAQKEVQTELKELVKNSGSETQAAVKKVNDLSETIQGIAARMLDIEQNMAENVKTGTAPIESLGQMVIKSDAYKEFAAGNSSRMKFQANTIIGQEGSPLENSNTIVAPQRLSGIIPGAFRALKLRDVLPAGVTSSNMVEYTRELLFTNNAAETNEGVTKPESVLTFELANAPVKTVAHFIKASKQVLDDAPALKSYIDTRMRYGVDYKIDYQLLNGNGTNPNISGLRDSGNYTAFTPVTGENALDSINRAIYSVYTAEYAPTVIIMNPADWGGLERIKKGTGDVSYVIGNPTGIMGPMLWGLHDFVTNAKNSGYFLIGAMDIAAQVWNREGVTVEMFEQDDVNVQKNLLTIRGEARLALAIYRPASVYSGLLTL